MKPILALMDCLCSRTSSSLFVFVHLKMNASIDDMRKLGEVSVTSAAMVDMLRAVQVNQGLAQCCFWWYVLLSHRSRDLFAASLQRGVCSSL